MKSNPAIYLGQIVEREHFRVNVYGPNNVKRVVESWDEFEEAMASGLWFDTKEKACMDLVEEKPKRKKRSKKESIQKVVSEDVEYDVITDDFLHSEDK